MGRASDEHNNTAHARAAADERVCARSGASSFLLKEGRRVASACGSVFVWSVALRVAGVRAVHCVARVSVGSAGYLVDPASSHMLVSKIKPCMSKYKRLVL